VDGRVYCLTEGSEPEAITPGKNPIIQTSPRLISYDRCADTTVGDRYRYRYAAFVIHPVYTHLLVAILEDHTHDEPANVVNTLCVINTRTKTAKSVKSVVTGADFYACPKFSPDGSQLGWQQWCHPDMPWEGAEVYIGKVVVDTKSDDFSIEDRVSIAGEPNNISCGYLEWTTNDTLIFTSDKSKYINPWKYTKGNSAPLFSKPVPQDFGSPMWFLNIFPYTILDKENKYALFIAINEGRDELQLVNLQGSAQPQRIGTDYVVIGSLRSVSKENKEVIFVGQKVDEAESIVRCTISISGDSPQATFTVLQSQAAKETKAFPKEIISTPKPPFSIDGDQGKIHIIYYPPKNPQYSGSSIAGERPPCVVQVHGGPTGLQQQGLDWKVQYFTSRGWAW
jgi:dipeptidyl aminopeptidase/acylaminoacyl peptidase